MSQYLIKSVNKKGKFCEKDNLRFNNSKLAENSVLND